MGWPTSSWTPVLAACAVGAIALRAGAQEQTAAIEGTVRDSLGAAVAGATVQVRSPAGLAVEQRSDGAGTYGFEVLPPGRYELAARLAGFVPALVADVGLRLGQRLEIDVALRPAGPDESVEVTGESPLVAITQSSRATSLRGDEIEKMPRGRDFTSLATQAAGANDERKLAGLSIDGSSGPENRIILDGPETGDTWVGVPGQRLVTDFVEELQVKSSGYGAEYGASTGGVLNAITKSGTNDWHGDALLYWSGDALDASPRASLRLDPSRPQACRPLPRRGGERPTRNGAQRPGGVPGAPSGTSPRPGCDGMGSPTKERDVVVPISRDLGPEQCQVPGCLEPGTRSHSSRAGSRRVDDQRIDQRRQDRESVQSLVAQRAHAL